jgi:hypothetical protein
MKALIHKYSFLKMLPVLIPFILAFLPFMILSFYANPYTDDFYYTFSGVQESFIDSQINWYNNWTGKFVSTAFLVLLNPLLLKSFFLYKTLSLVATFLFFVTTAYSVRSVFNGILSITELLIVSLSLGFLMLFKLPSIQSYYWMTSIYVYELPNLLFLVCIGMMFRIFISPQNEGNRNFPLLVICIILIAGSNETSMIMLTELLTISFIINTSMEKKINKKLLTLLIVSVLTSLIVYMAPGNEIRQMRFPQSHNLSQSIEGSFLDLMLFLEYRIIQSPLLIFVMMFLPFSYKFLKSGYAENRVFKLNPLLVMFILLVLLYTGYFISFYLTGETVLDRTLNVLHTFFFVGIIYIVIVSHNYVMQKFNVGEKGFLKKKSYILILLILPFFLFKNNITDSWKDVLNGNAQRFDAELKNRYDFIKNSRADTIFVRPVSVIPNSFNFEDITSDQNSFKNYSYSSFFEKNSIVLRISDE